MSEQQPEEQPDVAVARPGAAGGGGQAPPQDDSESGD
jgi:hypothetical protein